MGWLQRLDRLIALTIAVTQWLALPLIVLLFLQWPLRDIVHAYSQPGERFRPDHFRSVRGGQRYRGDAERRSPRRRYFGATLFRRARDIGSNASAPQ